MGFLLLKDGRKDASCRFFMFALVVVRGFYHSSLASGVHDNGGVAHEQIW